MESSWHRVIEARGPEQMQSLGESLARALRPGDVLLLSGGLGAGKTTLAQGLARALGSETAVTSPTFVLLIEHQTRLAPLLHLDAYRLEGLSYDEGREAGLEEFFERRDAVRLVEWPSMIPEWVEVYCAPAFTWRIAIENVENHEDARRVDLVAPLGREDAAEEALEVLQAGESKHR